MCFEWSRQSSSSQVTGGRHYFFTSRINARCCYCYLWLYSSVHAVLSRLAINSDCLFLSFFLSLSLSSREKKRRKKEERPTYIYALLVVSSHFHSLFDVTFHDLRDLRGFEKSFLSPNGRWRRDSPFGFLSRAPTKIPLLWDTVVLPFKGERGRTQKFLRKKFFPFSFFFP